MASNDWMDSEVKIGKDAEASDRTQICDSVATFMWVDWERPR
jgi:hypothetical protein